jgi:hypothetical protein
LPVNEVHAAAGRDDVNQRRLSLDDSPRAIAFFWFRRQERFCGGPSEAAMPISTLSASDRVRLQRGATHVHHLGARAVAEVLLELARARSGVPALLTKLDSLRERISPEMLGLSGGEECERNCGFPCRLCPGARWPRHRGIRRTHGGNDLSRMIWRDTFAHSSVLAAQRQVRIRVSDESLGRDNLIVRSAGISFDD